MKLFKGTEIVYIWFEEGIFPLPNQSIELANREKSSSSEQSISSEHSISPKNVRLISARKLLL